MRSLLWMTVVVTSAGVGLWAGRRIGSETSPPGEFLEIRLWEARAESDRLREELSRMRAIQAPFAEAPVAEALGPAGSAGPGADPLEKLRATLARGEIDSFVERFLEILDAVPSQQVFLANFLREWSGKLPSAAAEAILRVLDPRLQAALTKPGANPMVEAQLIALVGGPAAIDLLWKATETRGSPWQADMAFCLAGIEGGGAKEFVIRALEAPLDRNVRQPFVFWLARRPDALDDVLALLAERNMGPRDHAALQSGLVQQCLANPEGRDRFWKTAMSSPPEARRLLCSALVHAKDPRAQDWLLEEIRAGRWDAIPPQEWGALPRDRLESARESFARIAANPSNPFDARMSVAATLSRVDPDAAAWSILVDYEGMPETGRVRVVEALRLQGTREAAVWLRRIADTDPFQSVRLAAR